MTLYHFVFDWLVDVVDFDWLLYPEVFCMKNCSGGTGDPEDKIIFKASVSALEKDPKNQMHLSMAAYCYENGKGTPQDIQKAIELNMSGAELGDTQCYWNLGRIYSKYVPDKEKENCYFRFPHGLRAKAGVTMRARGRSVWLPRVAARTG